jgi:hypothetical protein
VHREVNTFTLSTPISFDEGEDQRAPGGAVTVELCGHWDHDGTCLYPHHSHIEHSENGFNLVVEVQCDIDELNDIQRRIHDALVHGFLVGPDGSSSTWKCEGPTIQISS